METTTLRERVAETLRQQIVAGEWAVGAVIPSAAAMSRKFGVSVPVVREALSHLRSQGLIASRQGSATVVQAKRPPAAFRIERLRMPDRRGLAELYAFRCDVESTTAERAARRARPSEIKALGRVLANLEAHLLEPTLSAEYDVAFHAAIARIAGTYHLQLISYMIEEFEAAIQTARQNSARWLGVTQKVHAEHEAIYAAIAARNPEQARDAMRKHLDGAARRLATSK